MSGFQDDERMEMAYYGSAYPEIRSKLEQALRLRDAVEGPMLNLLDEMNGYDLEVAERLLRDYEDILRSDGPVPTLIFREDIACYQLRLDAYRADLIRTLDIPDRVLKVSVIAEELQDAMAAQAALDFLDDTIADIKKYGKFIGAAEYSVELQAQGVTGDLWKAAAIRHKGGA